jgi:hypothetical protein
MKRPYPSYDVLDKWDSQSFDDVTRATLSRRLKDVPKRRFFTEAEWDLLEAVVARLIPQPDRETPIAITPWIDQQLAEDRNEGFRYHDLPPQRDAWRRGLAGIEAEAKARFDSAFIALDPDRQDAVLKAVHEGEVEEAHWQGLSARRFFKAVLLRTAATLYYAHPDAWSEMGFGGPAAPRGYVRLGVDKRDPWEPVAGR